MTCTIVVNGEKHEIEIEYPQCVATLPGGGEIKIAWQETDPPLPRVAEDQSDGPSVSHALTIGEWQKVAYAQSAKSGFHDEPAVFSEFTANMHSEASEMWEAYRKGQLNAPCDKADRMSEPLTCLEEELADIVIRALDTAETFGVDLERAVRVKHAFNGTRAHKHGGKLA